MSRAFGRQSLRVAVEELVCRAYGGELLPVVQGVCHRDLKLENILLDGCDPPHIKICDFGYSKVGHPAPQWRMLDRRRTSNPMCGLQAALLR